MASIGTTKTKEKRRKVNFLKMLYSYYLLVLNFKIKKKKCVHVCVGALSTDALDRPEESFRSPKLVRGPCTPPEMGAGD